MARLLVLLLAFGTLDAVAIAWRSDLEVVETKAVDEMKQVGQLLYSPLRVFGGSCLAMGGNWVLTSRHGTAKWKPKTLRVTFPALGATVYQVEKIVWPDDGDLALLRVDKPVRGAQDILVYGGNEEVGMRAWIGGFGLYGPARNLTGNGKFHAGHNRIDSIHQTKLRITLSRPDDPSVEKDEVIITLLDSGSPMFVMTPLGWRLAGIASSASNASDPGYGDRGHYARISTARKWIATTRARKPCPPNTLIPPPHARNHSISSVNVNGTSSPFRRCAFWRNG